MRWAQLLGGRSGRLAMKPALQKGPAPLPGMGGANCPLQLLPASQDRALLETPPFLLTQLEEGFLRPWVALTPKEAVGQLVLQPSQGGEARDSSWGSACCPKGFDSSGTIWGRRRVLGCGCKASFQSMARVPAPQSQGRQGGQQTPQTPGKSQPTLVNWCTMM